MTASKALAVIVAVALEATASAQGVVAFPQCGGGFLGLTYLMPRAETIAVFSGTVVDVRHLDTAMMVTFDVDRVWKGAISKRTALYRPDPASADSRASLQLGRTVCCAPSPQNPTAKASGGAVSARNCARSPAVRR